MKKPLILLFISFFLSLLIACDATPNASDKQSSPKKSSSKQSLTLVKGKPDAPAFKLLDMDDTEHKLSDYQGKPIIINFWATWCPPCREELPSMNRAWEKVKDDGIEMLAINVGEDEDTIFAFSGDYPIDFTVLLDESGEEINRWPIKGLPTTFVIDPQGRIVYQAVGGREWDDDTILDKVRALKK